MTHPLDAVNSMSSSEMPGNYVVFAEGPSRLREIEELGSSMAGRDESESGRWGRNSRRERVEGIIGGDGEQHVVARLRRSLRVDDKDDRHTRLPKDDTRPNHLTACRPSCGVQSTGYHIEVSANGTECRIQTSIKSPHAPTTKSAKISSV